MHMNEQFLIDNSFIENITWSVMGKQNSPAEKVYSIKCMRSLALATAFAMPQKRGKCSVLKPLYSSALITNRAYPMLPCRSL